MRILLCFLILFSFSLNGQIPKNSKAIIYQKSGEKMVMTTKSKIPVRAGIWSVYMRLKNKETKEVIKITNEEVDSVIFYTSESLKIKGRKEKRNLKRKFVFYQDDPESEDKRLVEEITIGKITVYRSHEYENYGIADGEFIVLYIFKEGVEPLKFLVKHAYHLKKQAPNLMSDCPKLLNELSKQKRFSDDDVLEYFVRYNNGCD